jgi:nicotinamide mononucleotide transporter
MGQWVLLVLKAGYFTNTTYGYIKWTKYIKNKEKEASQEQTPEQEETQNA